jgi:Ca2+-binding RTX toxin-like protein
MSPGRGLTTNPHGLDIAAGRSLEPRPTKWRVCDGGLGGGSDDTIVGSYRRDVIRGNGGENRLEGQGSHDQLEDGAGDDILIGNGCDLRQETDATGGVDYDNLGNDRPEGAQATTPCSPASTMTARR